MAQKTYDIIILGAGPAGLTAGIYAESKSAARKIEEAGGKILKAS